MMQNNIQIFSNPTFGTVRTAGTADNPQFCLADICKALDLSVKGVSQRLDKGVISNYPLSTPGGIQQFTFVNEDGLYDAIFDSRKPEAKAFRKWVTSEVLPSIRKTGGYIKTEETDSDADIMAKALQIAQRTINAKAQRIQMLEGENDSLNKEVAILAPKAQYTDDVLQSTSTYTFSQMAKELDFRSANALIKKLISERVMFKQSDAYMLMAKYSAKGYTKTRTYRFFHKDGTPGTSTNTVFTERGRMFLHDFFHIELPPVDFTEEPLNTESL